MGRWSSLVTKNFLASIDAVPNLEWLDVGCGTGALTALIVQETQPLSVKGMDPSAGFVQYARAHSADPRATFEVADAQSLPMASAQCDAAVAGLVLNFVANPSRAVAEMARTVRRGGVVAAYVWDYAGKMELMRYFWDAAVELDGAAFDLDEGRRFPLCQPNPLTELLTQAGLCEVQARPIDVPTRFRNFDDYWTPFLGGQAPAPGYVMSLTEARRAGPCGTEFAPSFPLRATAPLTWSHVLSPFVVEHQSSAYRCTP